MRDIVVFFHMLFLTRPAQFFCVTKCEQIAAVQGHYNLYITLKRIPLCAVIILCRLRSVCMLMEVANRTERANAIIPNGSIKESQWFHSILLFISL